MCCFSYRARATTAHEKHSSVASASHHTRTQDGTLVPVVAQAGLRLAHLARPSTRVEAPTTCYPLHISHVSLLPVLSYTVFCCVSSHRSSSFLHSFATLATGLRYFSFHEQTSPVLYHTHSLT